MSPCKIVIARYQEDISWSEGYDTFVVQKGEHIPNIGREPLSYIWYILTNYDTLEGIYFFVQGNPFAHFKDANRLFNNPERGFNWYSDLIADSDLDGKPYDGGLKIEEFLNNCGLKPKKDSWAFPAGCFFSIEAEQIKKHPKEYYQRVYDALLKTEKAPWAFERTVDLIFGVEQNDTK